MHPLIARGGVGGHLIQLDLRLDAERVDTDIFGGFGVGFGRFRRIELTGREKGPGTHVAFFDRPEDPARQRRFGDRSRESAIVSKP